MKKRYGWKPDIPDHRDLLYGSIKRQQAPFPDHVDLRPECSAVEDQGQLGSCTSNALAGNLEFLHKDFEASRLFIYYNERSLEGSVQEDSGAQLRDDIKTLSKQGVCSEYNWPYIISQFTFKPTPAAYEDAESRLITSYHRLLGQNDWLTCLAEGFPFVFGFTVFDGFESTYVAQTGILNIPEAGEKSLGGHAVCAVGYDLPSQRLIVRNSWGPSFGQGGYFTMPFEYAEKLADDFWTIRK